MLSRKVLGRFRELMLAVLKRMVSVERGSFGLRAVPDRLSVDQQRC
jgi:hypothetical protein